jgi:ABC-type bacteriocin/lantibiotic exporter with double-glycine peptidase domain
VATILRTYGFPVAEKELAIEAYTSRGGTENWYLARAIRSRGLKADFVIQPREHIAPPPSSLAGVLLPGGDGHFIAVMSESATDVVIADPLIGRLVISKAELERRYGFTGFFLVIHPPAKQKNLEAEKKSGF